MPPALLVAAAAAYACNVALGTAVAVRLIDTSRFRWLHHALYTTTCVLSGCALSALLATGDRGARQTASVLAPAAVPLAMVPFVDARSPRHPLVALAAAPFFAAAVVRSRKEVG
ncbi:hypothetical protein EEJ31_13090 [Cryobacterium tepidiphilum]|uniref:Uncharacterized protein n=2 Tax=Cryobacterium tepidiphilum TaxID=2486026 RepID=A0A3M8KVT8_9MICO|nr:hypothetical protein EEJ31_13090 [Cryobacterium tepidiphilum]